MSQPINIRDGEWSEFGHGEAFKSQRKGLTDRTANKGIGCSLYRVAPGKAAFPKHGHLANDEAVFVLKGSGTMIVGDKEFAVEEGDYVSLPKGEDGAHKLVNTSDADIEYLCFSTMCSPEVVFYPDSNKTGVIHFDSTHRIREIYDRTPVDYWKGETD